MLIDFLKEVLPKANAEHIEVWATILPPKLITYELNTPVRIAHFFAQGYVESVGFTRFEENLFYSTPERIKVIFGRHIKDSELKDFAKNPEKLANRVYANRMGNGDEASGDGFRYRGRGIFQLTGKSNYKKATDDLGTDYVGYPDQVANCKHAMITALHFWKANNLNNLANKDTDDAVKAVTKIVNGGYNALAERTQAFRVIYPAATKYFK